MCDDFYTMERTDGKGLAGDFRLIRNALDKSQSEMALLLGISIRALQSYEQGWRRIPANVMRMGWLLLSLDRQKGMAATIAPCWQVRACPPEGRELCPVYEFQAGAICWLIPTKSHGGERLASTSAKVEKCLRCPVITRWLA